MKKSIHYLLLTAFTFVLISSCKKYPDGPGISILSRKQRLSNTWHLTSYYENGADKTSDFNTIFQGAVINIEKEGSYSFSYKLFGSVDYNETGTWRFTDNDAYFETNPNNGSGSTGKHYILRLKEKELWYTDTDANGIVREYHLIP